MNSKVSGFSSVFRWGCKRFLFPLILLSIPLYLYLTIPLKSTTETGDIQPRLDILNVSKISVLTIKKTLNSKWQRKLERYGEKKVDQDLQEKRNTIKSMMKECWDVYRKYAFGSNEVNLNTKSGVSRSDIHHSMNGVTIVDSLDTLLIMNLYDEYLDARKWVEKNLNFEPGQTINLFEANIRILGGLLSTYYLTGDTMFLKKATRFGNLTVTSFNSRLPNNIIRFSETEEASNNPTNCIAQLGTLHLEYTALSHVTGNKMYEEKVMGIRNKLSKFFYSINGPIPNSIRINDISSSSGSATMGSEGDSFYEYLIKSYVQKRTNTDALSFFKDAAKRIEDHTLKKHNEFTYFASSTARMEHLACFSGGMYALASKYVDKELSKHYLDVSKNITNTCLTSCLVAASGLCPDLIVVSDLDAGTHYPSGYFLRPELMESLFYLYRITGEDKYRESAWILIKNIMLNAKFSDGGYSGVDDVHQVPTNKNGAQESFFLAETLKYAYLIFSHPDFISLDQWVFNTEAHPLLIQKHRST